MARQKGIIKLKGTIGGVTFVDSKAYGAHTRAARGTHKKAKVNDTLKDNAGKAKPVSFLASPILTQLKTLESGFVAGDLWPRMTGRMFKSKSMKTGDLLESLKDVELNERYAFAKLFAVSPSFAFTIRKNVLAIEMELLSHALFSRHVKASHYLCEVAVLFGDGKGAWLMDKIETDWISLKEPLGVYEMEFERPKCAKYFLLIAGVKGSRDERPIESFAARGYCIMEGSVLS